jgi:membrane protease YdiL (CAAX protease family)
MRQIGPPLIGIILPSLTAKLIGALMLGAFALFGTIEQVLVLDASQASQVCADAPQSCFRERSSDVQIRHVRFEPAAAVAPDGTVAAGRFHVRIDMPWWRFAAQRMAQWDAQAIRISGFTSRVEFRLGPRWVAESLARLLWMAIWLAPLWALRRTPWGPADAGRPPVRVLPCMLVLALLLIACLGLALFTLDPTVPADELPRFLRADATAPEGVLLPLLVASVTEEAVFRYALLAAWLGTLGRAGAVTVSSLGFALIHVDLALVGVLAAGQWPALPLLLTQAGLYLLAGLLFCGLLYWSRSLIACIGLHVAWNTFHQLAL